MDKFPGVPLTADQLREVTRRAIEKKDKDNAEWFERLVLDVSRMLWREAEFNAKSSFMIPSTFVGGSSDEDGYKLNEYWMERLTNRLKKDGYDAVMTYNTLTIKVSWNEKK